MLYENIEMSGSLEVTGSFIVPLGTSSVSASYEKGRMMIEKDSGRLFVWTGSWATIGTQENPQSAPTSVFSNVVDLTASLASSTNMVTMSLSEADNITSTPFSASISGSSFEIIWSNADSSSGFIRNTTTLSAGTYYYNVTVFDSGSINSQSYNNQTVTVAASPVDESNVEYLVVAGGASGGSNGGGGGAGGYLSSSLSSIQSGSSITVTIGAGGSDSVSYQARGNDGSDSSIASAAGTSFSTVTATGGGGGASNDSPDGKDGGSGGGAGSSPSGGGHSGGSGTAGQGNRGGNTSANGHPYVGAGGGGAGAQGTDVSTTPGAGGDGKQSSISGTSTYYAGGGGGTGGTQGATGGAGGQGGGGQGGVGSSGQDGFAALPNTGGGGGSSGDAGGVGAGGSGIVILAYPTGSISAIGGTRTSTSDGRAVHTFNNSGTLKFGQKTDYTAFAGDYFTTVQYEGTGASRSLTTSFAPDLVWIKHRDGTGSHSWTDRVRGDDNVLQSNETSAEASGQINLNSDGFTIRNNNALRNSAGERYVAWCFKAGGSSVSNSDGSITSNVSANTTTGFSIVTYSGNGSNGTVGHGLSSAPELIITKKRNGTSNWSVSGTVAGLTPGTNKLTLNGTGAISSDTNEVLAISSTTFTAGASSAVGQSGGTYVAYCFHSVAGYQKVGSYSGTGSDTYVDLGFAPNWIMARRVAATGDRWLIADNTRHEATENDAFLDAQDSHAESTLGATNGITFGSNGFTVRATDGALNNSAGTYLYIAIG